MKFDLSIIITHFNPSNSNKENPLEKTLQIIDNQKSNYKIEIIIADDGSYYTKGIINQYSEKYKIDHDERSIYFAKSEKLGLLFDVINLKSNLITQWVYLPKTKNSAVRIKDNTKAIVSGFIPSKYLSKFLFKMKI